MGINLTLSDAVDRLSPLYGLSDDGHPPDKVREFLGLTAPSRFAYRQKTAIAIITALTMTHGKYDLLPYVSELAHVEPRIRRLQPRQRDHVVHALLSFFLGMYINEHFMERRYRPNPFQWKLAGLFHDIGYPAEVASKMLGSFTHNINHIKSTLGVPALDVSFNIWSERLPELTNGVSGLALIQKQLDRWGLKINAWKEYDNMAKSGRLCHGIISSLALLYVVDLLYQKNNPLRDHVDTPGPNNWNQSIFEEDVVPACSAIFVHNLRAECFAGAPLRKETAPLAFLLKLSDTLQDWERPSGSDSRGLSNRGFDIRIGGGQLEFFVANRRHRHNITKELRSCLDLENIKVHPLTALHPVRIPRGR